VAAAETKPSESLDRGYLAALVALFLPSALLAGAYAGEYLFGLYPCEMCLWQRYPLFAAIPLAVAGLFLSRADRRALGVVATALAATGLLASGLIGGFHAGVEYGWWDGPGACAAAPQAGAGEDFWQSMMAAPAVRCDRPAFTLFGLSLAGYNFVISTAGAAFLAALLTSSAALRASDGGEQEARA
jgi:disulfide bond formation protein DsbB